jgi:hypothetical protein
MPTYKILVYLAVWKRPEITEICFQGIKRLQAHPDYEIQALAVISEVDMIPLCEKYSIQWVMTENYHVGRKKNFGLQACKDFDFDFLMEIGSDDLVLNSLLDDYKKFMVKYDFSGVREMGFIDTETGSCRRWSSATVYGAGRLISRKALDMVGWRLWRDNQDKGLDVMSIVTLHKKGVMYWQIPPGDYPKVVDIKSEVNIWPFNHLNGEKYDINLILEHLSEQEKDSLKCLLQKRRSAEWIEG